MSDDFRASLIAHARIAIERSGRAATEAATNQYLVLPFIQFLGYDPLDPDEVVPESHASFSDKFKNRVDYAICQAGTPVIAIECKKVGALSEANRGELKGYFNAVPTVKLGILTDGLVYQLYTDTGLENMMDDQPFAILNLAEVAEERVSDTELDALLRVRKGTFNPANVGSDARRKIYVGAYMAALDQALSEPDERFVRTLLDMANIEGRRTTRMVEEHAPIVREAAQALLDRMILARVGFAERTDLVRVPDVGPRARPGAGSRGPCASRRERHRRRHHRGGAARDGLRAHPPAVPDRGGRSAVREAGQHHERGLQDGVLRLLQAGAEGPDLQLLGGPRRRPVPVRVPGRGGKRERRDRQPGGHRRAPARHLPPPRRGDGLRAGGSEHSSQPTGFMSFPAPAGFSRWGLRSLSPTSDGRALRAGRDLWPCQRVPTKS
jgi:hypothetical protein